MIARYLTSVTSGAVVTFGLLLLMQRLIATGEEAITPSKPGISGTYVRVERDKHVIIDRRLPDPPDEVKPPPVLPPIVDDVGTGGAVVAIGPPLPPSIGPGERGFERYAVRDGGLLPLVAAAPVYPARAIARHLDGYVVLEFTVTEIGSVRDAFVVTSTNSIFDRPALEAVYKFKYRPRVVDGEPVETPGTRRKFTFVLEQ